MQDVLLKRIGLPEADKTRLKGQIATFSAAYSQWQAQAGPAPLPLWNSRRGRWSWVLGIQSSRRSRRMEPADLYSTYNRRKLT